MEKVLVIGATSAIAQAVLRLLVSRGAGVFLVGRDERRLAVVRDDLLARGASTAAFKSMDFSCTNLFQEVVSQAEKELDGLTMLLVAHGTLTDQARAQIDPTYMTEQTIVNYSSGAAFVGVVANRLEKLQSGKIVVIGSVAGDRGRQSNYVYGAAKSALATFLQGLTVRLAKSQVQVLLVKPGFVDTPMTAHLAKNFLYSSPDRIAKDIVRAMDGKKRVVYSPWYWRYIMIVIRLIPAVVFNRMNL